MLAMLGCDAGATLAEISVATDWQPHSGRAMLSILRKQGHAITRETGESCYVLAGHA